VRGAFNISSGAGGRSAIDLEKVNPVEGGRHHRGFFPRRLGSGVTSRLDAKVAT
jgi:hypothetical protein